MLVNEMTPELRGVLRVFNDEARRAGWEVEEFSEMLDAGMAVNPEGMASLENESAALEMHLSLPERELRVFIRDRITDQLVRLVLAFKDVEEILRRLIAYQDRLDTKTFPDFLVQVSRFAEQVWFVDHEGARFLLEFSNVSDDTQ